jgi:hypothetical protein
MLTAGDWAGGRLLSAQGMDAPAIAKVVFTSEDRVRDAIRSFNADGFSSLYPRVRDELAAAGLPVPAPGLNPVLAGGAEVMVDGGADMAGGVFVRWSASPRLRTGPHQACRPSGRCAMRKWRRPATRQATRAMTPADGGATAHHHAYVGSLRHAVDRPNVA